MFVLCFPPFELLNAGILEKCAVILLNSQYKHFPTEFCNSGGLGKGLRVAVMLVLGICLESQALSAVPLEEAMVMASWQGCSPPSPMKGHLRSIPQLPITAISGSLPLDWPHQPLIL